jgi:hypothetical protein
MKKRWALAGALAAVVTVGAGTTAGAIPDKEPEQWVCGTTATPIVTAGRNGWINGVKYKALELTINGTFTPTGGTAQPFTEFKQWAGGGAGITCTMHVDETDDEGHFVADFTVIAVPA